MGDLPETYAFTRMRWIEGLHAQFMCGKDGILTARIEPYVVFAWFWAIIRASKIPFGDECCDTSTNPGFG